MTVEITYYSDMLCIWAYVAEARLVAVQQSFGTDVTIRHRFCSVFGDARGKLAAGWRERGGLAGYNRHVTGIAARFPHIAVAPSVWLDHQPASSASPHLFLTAVKQWEHATRPDAEPVFEALMAALRRAFFAEGRDIAQWAVQVAVAEAFGVDIAAIEARYRDGTAFAELSADYQDADKLRIEGSPTLVLNEGRQKLYGNVGFRIIEANIKEMLREPTADQASWC